MTKKYERPSIKLHEVTNDYQILAGSGSPTLSTPPTNGLDVRPPENGGQNDGTHEVGAKNNSFNVWSDDE